MNKPLRLLFSKLILAAQLFVLPISVLHAAPPEFSEVLPDKPLHFPQDFGAHPAFRTEWWYVTGWLTTPDNKPLGFQITFFRSATDNDAANPSQFAPKQLIIGHAALSDPASGKLQHVQKSAREGFGLAYAKVGDTDVKLDDWQFTRDAQGHYTTAINTPDFSLHLALTPSQALLLEGDQGYSRKGPQPLQASYYYSEPQLLVSGTVIRKGKAQTINGKAWLDHEWSSHVLDKDATGWDWVGANLDDGSALMAFQIRDTRGDKLWSHATLRDASGQVAQFGADQVSFEPVRLWHSPHTNTNYPVATKVHVNSTWWELVPLQDDQELDARQSSGAVYWEGAMNVLHDGKNAGHGYLEMTGYVSPIKL